MVVPRLGKHWMLCQEEDVRHERRNDYYHQPSHPAMMRTMTKR
jgi:hypothetical protein